MYMVMYVCDDAGRLNEVLDALCAAGVTGATIVESTGMHRQRARRKRLHLRFPFEGSDDPQMKDNLTLFIIVSDESVVEVCIGAIERVVGDLDNPNNGILAAWPLSIVKGLRLGTCQTCAGQEGAAP